MKTKDPLDCGECYHGHDCHACLQLAYNSLESLVQRQAELLERVRNCHHYNGMGDWGWDLHGLDIILKDLAALGEE